MGRPASVIYSLIINSQVFKQGWRDYTSRSLHNFGIDEEQQQVIYCNHERLPTWVPDYAVFKQVLIWHNALQTTEHLGRIYAKSRSRGEERKSPHVRQVHQCYLCRDNEDSTEHIFGNCKVVKQALIKLWDTLGIEEVEELATQDSYLDFALLNWGDSSSNSSRTDSTNSNGSSSNRSSNNSNSNSSISSGSMSSISSCGSRSSGNNGSSSSSSSSSSNGSGRSSRGTSSNASITHTVTTDSAIATATTLTTTTLHAATSTHKAQLKDGKEFTQFKIGLQYVFNFLVWKNRENIKDGRDAEEGVIDRIYRSTLNRVSWLAPAALTDEQLPGNKLSEEDKDMFASRVRSYGASGKRTPAQKAAARAAAAKIQESLPEHAIEIWTDGSRIGKSIPGPAGAGAVIMRKGEVQQELTYYLGNSTNQAAELWAIGGALESLPSPCTGDREVHVFTDSQFSIDCVSGKYFSPKHYHRIAKIRKIARQLRCTVSYHHVAGHAGIPGNEHADRLANAGARYSKNNNSFEELSLDDILEHYSFDYLKLDWIT